MPWLRSLCTLLLCTLVVRGGDWPQWLGPTRNAASPEKVTPWNSPPKVLWRKPVGEGNSAPAVAKGRVFIHAKVRDKNVEEVVAFDAKTGNELWRTPYPRAAFKSPYGNGSRATPAVAGGKVYSFGITGLLTCFEADGGKQVWQVDTLKKFGAKNLFFGAACSPLVAGKHVFVAVGAKEASVVAFDKDTGETAWKSQSDGASYSSPILIEADKTRQLVFLTALGVVSLNPADGALYWRSPLKDLLFESSTTPIRAGDMLMASSITVGSVGLRLGDKDGAPAVEQVWKNTALTSYFSTPVPIGPDHIYMVTGTNPLAALTERKTEATLRCIEARTGKELWKRPKVGKYHASLMRTGDNKLLMLEEPGNLVLLDPSPKEYRELARAKVCGETWAHPALSDGRFYVRDNKGLICLQLAE
jgi:outer membrane protein assembly factor BamB